MEKAAAKILTCEASGELLIFHTLDKVLEEELTLLKRSVPAIQTLPLAFQ